MKNWDPNSRFPNLENMAYFHRVTNTLSMRTLLYFTYVCVGDHIVMPNILFLYSFDRKELSVNGMLNMAKDLNPVKVHA